MSQRDGGYRRNNRKDKPKGQLGEKGKEVFKNIDENNPVIKAFAGYSHQLDQKHDRHERLVKISRDITIESKRIIFLLHNVDIESKRESILQEADTRLKKLVDNQFKQIALELENEDKYQFLRAYTAGMQEFIEAYTFFQYLQDISIKDWNNIQNELTYNHESTDETVQVVKTHIPPEEYVLGIADLTGELMRKCINNLGSGNIDDCFSTCNFVKHMYNGFLLVGNTCNGKEISRKAYVLKQSLQKMENVCYNIVVRGNEIPKHMLSNIIPTASNADTYSDDDEGYF